MKNQMSAQCVTDCSAKVRVNADGSSIDLANIRMSMIPFDEISVEDVIWLEGPEGIPGRPASVTGASPSVETRQDIARMQDFPDDLMSPLSLAGRRP